MHKNYMIEDYKIMLLKQNSYKYLVTITKQCINSLISLKNDRAFLSFFHLPPIPSQLTSTTLDMNVLSHLEIFMYDTFHNSYHT